MQTTPSRERGANVLEAIGIIVAASVIVGMIVAAVTQADITTAVRQAICSILQQGCESLPPDEHKPTEPCVNDAQGWAMNAKVAVGVSAGKNGNVLIERLSNGKYRVTTMEGVQLGVDAGVGWDARVEVDGAKYGADVSANANAHLLADRTTTYEVSSQAEAERIQEWFAYTQARDLATNHSPLTGPLVDQVAKRLGLQPPPPPTSYTVRGGDTAEASAQDSAVVLGGEVKASSTALLGRQWNADGSHVDVGAIDLTAYASGNALWKYGKAPASWKPSYEDTFDANGRRTSTTLAYTVDTPDGPVVTRYTLPIRNADDDRAAKDMLLYPWKIGDFEQRVRDRGQLTEVTYNKAGSHDVKVALGGKFLADVGVEVGGARTLLDTSRARYWDGSSWVTWEGCA